LLEKTEGRYWSYFQHHKEITYWQYDEQNFVLSLKEVYARSILKLET
jgi:hypothetical protein